MASRMVLTQKRWNEHIEDRVSTTSNMLAQMRDVKMLGLAPSMGKHLEALHDKETEVSLENRTVVSATFGISKRYFFFLSPSLSLLARISELT